MTRLGEVMIAYGETYRERENRCKTIFFFRVYQQDSCKQRTENELLGLHKGQYVINNEVEMAAKALFFFF